MSTSDRVIMGVDGVQFFEPDLIHKVTLRNAGPLDGDTYVDLPTTSGTLATQEYVAANAGGSLTAYRTSEIARTSPTIAADTDMQIVVEGNSAYRLDVYLSAVYTGTSYLKFDFTGPSGCVLKLHGLTDAGNAVYSEIGAPVSLTASDFAVLLSGSLHTTDAGSIGLSWGVTTGSDAVSIEKASHIVATKLN